jgi:hypothetical protein
LTGLYLPIKIHRRRSRTRYLALLLPGSWREPANKCRGDDV